MKEIISLYFGGTKDKPNSAELSVEEMKRQIDAGELEPSFEPRFVRLASSGDYVNDEDGERQIRDNNDIIEEALRNTDRAIVLGLGNKALYQGKYRLAEDEPALLASASHLIQPTLQSAARRLQDTSDEPWLQGFTSTNGEISVFDPQRVPRGAYHAWTFNAAYRHGLELAAGNGREAQVGALALPPLPERSSPHYKVSLQRNTGALAVAGEYLAVA